MRFFVLAVAPLLVASTTLARSLLKRGPTTDTCANLDADLVFSDVHVDGKPYDAGHIDVGICLSQVKMFVGHYNVTEAAAKVVGVDKVELVVADMIKNTGVQCSYPPHAVPTVTSNNECDFVCGDGFLDMPPNHPSSCVCPPHLTVCDGKCSQSKSDCSKTPPPSRRQNDPRCAEGLVMCGVPGATSGEAYKCTDVASDSYTCGGCVKASPFGSPSVTGVDCHGIPNVDEVSCRDNECVVHTCKNGFVVSASNDGCVVDPCGQSARARSVPGVDRLVSSG